MKHIKHQDSLDVQVRTKFLDVEGHELPNVIEYDPTTGYGKRIKRDAPTDTALIEDFYHKDGSVEIDGHNFDDTNSDEDTVESVKTLIDMGVKKNDPSYTELLQHHTDLHRKEKEKFKQGLTTATTATTATASNIGTFTHSGRYQTGSKVEINLETGEARILEALIDTDAKAHEDTQAQTAKEQTELKQRRARKEGK